MMIDEKIKIPAMTANPILLQKIYHSEVYHLMRNA